MAESRESTLEGSDELLDTYCEPCYAASDKMKPVAGHCKNCDENLCKKCFTFHHGHKLFRKHKLVKKSPRPILQPTLKVWLKTVFYNTVRKYLLAVIFLIVAIILYSKTAYKPVVSKPDQQAKRPIHVKDITVTSYLDKPTTVYGSLVLSNKQILITDSENKKLKLIDTDQDKIISEIQLSGSPMCITKIKADEIVVTLWMPESVQFISVSHNSMSIVREVFGPGHCGEGITYNDKAQALIVTCIDPSYVKILSMVGHEIKSIEHNSMGDELFGFPLGVAMTPDMTGIYVTDWKDNSDVTLLSMNGDVKAVYTDKTGRLQSPCDLYVHTSGLVYVIGYMTDTVHELDPESGEFKVVLKLKDGLVFPLSISYCEIEDKMYLGMIQSNVLKVFQMK